MDNKQTELNSDEEKKLRRRIKDAVFKTSDIQALIKIAMLLNVKIK